MKNDKKIRKNKLSFILPVLFLIIGFYFWAQSEKPNQKPVVQIEPSFVPISKEKNFKEKEEKKQNTEKKKIKLLNIPSIFENILENFQYSVRNDCPESLKLKSDSNGLYCYSEVSNYTTTKALYKDNYLYQYIHLTELKDPPFKMVKRVEKTESGWKFSFHINEVTPLKITYKNNKVSNFQWDKESYQKISTIFENTKQLIQKKHSNLLKNADPDFDQDSVNEDELNEMRYYFSTVSVLYELIFETCKKSNIKECSEQNTQKMIMELDLISSLIQEI